MLLDEVKHGSETLNCGKNQKLWISMFSFAAGVRIALSRDKSVRNSPFDKSNMFFLFNQIYHCLCQKLTLKCPLIGSLLISRAIFMMKNMSLFVECYSIIFIFSDPTCNEVQQSSLSPTPSHSSQSSVFSVSTPTARITTSSALVSNSWSYMFPSVSAVSSASTALALQSSIAVQCQGTFADTLTAVRYLIQGC